AGRLAETLRGLRVGPEVRVGLCVERSVEMIVGILGILEAGGAYVPLDPAYPESRLRYGVEDAGLRVLLTQSHLRNRLPGGGSSPLPQPPPPRGEGQDGPVVLDLDGGIVSGA